MVVLRKRLPGLHDSEKSMLLIDAGCQPVFLTKLPGNRLKTFKLFR